MSEMMNRLRTTPGAFCLFCAVFSVIGGLLIVGSPAQFIASGPGYATTVLVSIALLNLFAYIGPFPLLWVVAAGFMLMQLDPAIRAVVGKGGVDGSARLGYIIVLVGNLFSFLGSNPSLSAANADTFEQRTDKFVFSVALLMLIGEICMWSTGAVKCKAAWLAIVYVASAVTGFQPGGAFIVFAATVMAPRFFLQAVQTSGLFQVGMLICSVALAAIVAHFMHGRYQSDGAIQLDRAVFDIRNYFGSSYMLTRLVFLLCGVAGITMVWMEANDQYPALVDSALLFIGTLLNHVSLDMKFNRLVIIAITLIYAIADFGASYARDAALSTDDTLLLGWILLFIGAAGSTVLALPVNFSNLPSLKNKNVLASTILGLTLIGGCIAVWTDQRTDNNVLNLGLLGLVLMFSGSYGYHEGVEVVFHAAILLVAVFSPSTLIYFPWIALVCAILSYVLTGGRGDYTEIGGSSGGINWRPVFA